MSQTPTNEPDEPIPIAAPEPVPGPEPVSPELCPSCASGRPSRRRSHSSGRRVGFCMNPYHGDYFSDEDRDTLRTEEDKITLRLAQEAQAAPARAKQNQLDRIEAMLVQLTVKEPMPWKVEPEKPGSGSVEKCNTSQPPPPFAAPVPAPDALATLDRTVRP